MYYFNDIVACINESDDIIIITHTNMDGDAMGSASALCHALRKLGKRAVVLLEDKAPQYLNFIHRQEDEDRFGPIFTNELSFKPKLAIAVDCNRESRFPKRFELYKSANKRICIDHHIGYEEFADYALVDSNAAAAGLLVYETIKALGVPIDKHMAEDLYVAIATDTGMFKYAQAKAEVHRVVAELFEYDIDHVTLCNAIYDDYPVSQIEAEAVAINNMEFLAGGRGIISSITMSEMAAIGASYDQVDTCVDRLKSIRGVEIAAFIKEKEPGMFKVSLRSKKYADVNAIAERLNGGGHKMAAGGNLNMCLEEALAKTKKEIEEEFNKYDRNFGN